MKNLKPELIKLAAKRRLQNEQYRIQAARVAALREVEAVPLVGYTIVSDGNPQVLSKTVSGMFINGWEPHGGVMVAFNPTHIVYSQALVLRRVHLKRKNTKRK